MAKLQTLFLLFGFTIAWVGCGKSDNLGVPTAATASSAAGRVPSNPVAQVVHEFLEAVRIGNTDGASRLLTPLALQRTSEMDLNFSPPGSNTAQFRVGEVEMIDDQRALVRCVWSDLDADGKPSSEQITWALKLAEGQWRISGMAAELGNDQPPMVMDFENPGDLLEPGAPASAVRDSPRQASQAAQDPFQQPVSR